jgi:molecular chaperone Hsp31 and glyoxalase 3
MIRKLLGIAPQPTPGGAYKPSPVALKFATADKTDYQAQQYANAYTGGDLKILVLCTEEGQMTMQNGKKFSTGNHPVELFVPLLHLRQAGFDLVFTTPTGQAAKLEHWAFPEKDAQVQAIYADYKKALENPRSLQELVPSLDEHSPYAAVFIPGGHGAMLGLPDDPNVGQLLHWANQHDRFVVSICHGPAALLASAKVESGFLYNGYSITAFPDSTDRQTPLIGYMPGQMTWHLGERLDDYNVTILNKKPDTSCHVDRKLITGASPYAANNLGQLAAQTILDSL